MDEDGPTVVGSQEQLMERWKRRILLSPFVQAWVEEAVQSNRRPRSRRGFVLLWLQQVYVLLHKNWILLLRNPRNSLLQLFAPVLFMLLLYGIQEAVLANSRQASNFKVVETPESISVGGIPPCVLGPGRDFCYTFAYAPDGDPRVREVVRLIRELNTPPLGPDEVIGFSSSSEIDDFMVANLNTTQASYTFNFTMANVTTLADRGASRPVSLLSYSVQYNQTNTRKYVTTIVQSTYLLAPLVVAAERALLRYALNNSDVRLDVARVPFPHEALEPSTIVADAGPIFILGALIFNWVVYVGNMVGEKELHLRSSMRLMGLKDSAFWFSWFVTAMAISTVTVLLLIATGYAVQFDFFIKNNFFTFFILFELFALSLVCSGLLVFSFLSKARSATMAAFGVFAISILIIDAASLFYTDNTTSYLLFQLVLAFFSPTFLAKGMSDLVDQSSGSQAGLSFSDIGTYTDYWPLTTMYLWLCIDSLIYTLLALYLDNVLKDEYGVRRGFFFFLDFRFWVGKPIFPDFTLFSGGSVAAAQFDPHLPFDSDVAAMELALKNVPLSAGLRGLSAGDIDRASPYVGATAASVQDIGEDFDGDVTNNEHTHDLAVRISDINRSFPGFRKGGLCRCGCNKLACPFCPAILCGKRVKKFVAVDDMWLGIENNQLFCLLGHNGAGKTTLINMLTGVLPPSGGNAYLFGNSIRSQMPRIRSLMGVCPQFDVLWEELTPKEHLRLFAQIRGIPRSELRREVRDRLRGVGLTRVRDKPAGQFSGGMKRRLSVAVALIGDPRVVFLDEPTTGMDPVSRRRVWDIIEEAKKDRCIVLTTHSMEEADILGDKIAVQAAGRLECIGTSLHLKQKYGAGYRATVTFDLAHQTEVMSLFLDNLPGSVVEVAPINGYTVINIPRACLPQLPAFFERVESKGRDLGVTDVQLSLTTLEEVFSVITDAAEERLHAAHPPRRIPLITPAKEWLVRQRDAAEERALDGLGYVFYQVFERLPLMLIDRALDSIGLERSSLSSDGEAADDDESVAKKMQ